MFCSQIFPFLSVWIFWTFKVLERISSISTYNVVHAGAWDQSKRDMHFFRVLKPHGLFFFFFFSSEVKRLLLKTTTRSMKARCDWIPFYQKRKNKISRTCCLSQILEPSGCEFAILRDIFVNDIWEAKDLVLTFAYQRDFSNCKNLLCFLARKRVFLT